MCTIAIMLYIKQTTGCQQPASLCLYVDVGFNDWQNVASGILMIRAQSALLYKTFNKTMVALLSYNQVVV